MDKRDWRQHRRHRQKRHDCRGKTHGNPKVGDGMCRRGDHKYREAVIFRQNWRRDVREWWLAWLAGQDLLDVEA